MPPRDTAALHPPALREDYIAGDCNDLCPAGLYHASVRSVTSVVVAHKPSGGRAVVLRAVIDGCLLQNLAGRRRLIGDNHLPLRRRGRNDRRLNNNDGRRRWCRGVYNLGFLAAAAGQKSCSCECHDNHSFHDGVLPSVLIANAARSLEFPKTHQSNQWDGVRPEFGASSFATGAAPVT
jgi:hypothetical protein